MTEPRGHIAVIGAGIGGLGATLAMSRAGYRVTLIERDDTPLPNSVEAAFEWDRRGAPQVRHSHGYAARLHNILRSQFPDVLDELCKAGAVEHDLGAMLPDEVRRDIDELKVIAARRTTYEWVLRRAATRSPLVDLRVGVGVDGLLADTLSNAEVTHIIGVRLDDETSIEADAVIASTGPHSDLARWLEPHGVDIPEVVAKTGITYLTRFYRLQPGRSLPGGVLQTSSRRAGLSYSCVGADNGTFSITIAVESTDGELRRHLLAPGRFEAVCQMLPGIDTLTDEQDAYLASWAIGT
ncbi:MAG: FAD-dependent monooxygenase [Acidobacteria bacterium]|nr:FAD-dependent monooxygenase [Acidobacteriota bacterium]